ncbi:hypothetical protein ADUPG1_000006, partial [Aduncisulcus paluster]
MITRKLRIEGLGALPKNIMRYIVENSSDLANITARIDQCGCGILVCKRMVFIWSAVVIPDTTGVRKVTDAKVAKLILPEGEKTISDFVFLDSQYDLPSEVFIVTIKGSILYYNSCKAGTELLPLTSNTNCSTKSIWSALDKNGKKIEHIGEEWVTAAYFVPCNTDPVILIGTSREQLFSFHIKKKESIKDSHRFTMFGQASKYTLLHSTLIQKEKGTSFAGKAFAFIKNMISKKIDPKHILKFILYPYSVTTSTNPDEFALIVVTSTSISSFSFSSEKKTLFDVISERKRIDLYEEGEGRILSAVEGSNNQIILFCEENNPFLEESSLIHPLKVLSIDSFSLAVLSHPNNPISIPHAPPVPLSLSTISHNRVKASSYPILLSPNHINEAFLLSSSSEKPSASRLGSVSITSASSRKKALGAFQTRNSLATLSVPTDNRAPSAPTSLPGSILGAGTFSPHTIRMRPNLAFSVVPSSVLLILVDGPSTKSV